MSFMPSRQSPGPICLALALALACGPAAAGVAATVEAESVAADVQRVDAAVRDHGQAHARFAQARGDAASVAAAALLLAPRGAADEDRRTALDWLDEALRRHPGDAGLAWAGLRVCGGDPACDRQPWLDRLARLQPGNAAVWVAHLEHADPAMPRATLLGRALAAPDWQPDATVLRAAVLDAWQAIDLAPATAAAIERVLGEDGEAGSVSGDRLTPAHKLAMAQAADLHDLSGLAALVAACRSHRHGAGACAPLWQRIAGLGESLLEAGHAAARLAELAATAGDDEGQRYWQAERAAIDWQGRQAAALAQGEVDVATFWPLLRARGELAAFRHLLHQVGLPLAPPPGHDEPGVEGGPPPWSSAGGLD